VPGGTVSEVYPRYVMLSDGGVMKRVDLATDATAGTSLSMRGPGQAGAAPAAGGAAMPQGMMPEPPMSPGMVQPGQASEGSPAEEPPAAGGQAPQANQPPPPPPPLQQMPQPVRGNGSPVPQPSSAR
jgi:general secretion pathway protein C